MTRTRVCTTVAGPALASAAITASEAAAAAENVALVRSGRGAQPLQAQGAAAHWALDRGHCVPDFAMPCTSYFVILADLCTAHRPSRSD